MKVAELEGAQLDYWVAKALGYSVERANFGPGWIVATAGMGARVTGLPLNNPMHWSPSQDWAQGGPIIDLKQINIQNMAAGICAAVYQPMARVRWYSGPTVLVAAMRALVATEFGNEVTDA